MLFYGMANGSETVFSTIALMVINEITRKNILFDEIVPRNNWRARIAVLPFMAFSTGSIVLGLITYWITTA